MIQPDSLEELPLLKHHATPGDHRDSLDDYADLAEDKTMSEGSNGPTCERCGGRLEQPEDGAQYECDDCGMVVAPDMIREPKRNGWGGRHD